MTLKKQAFFVKTQAYCWSCAFSHPQTPWWLVNYPNINIFKGLMENAVARIFWNHKWKLPIVIKSKPKIRRVSSYPRIDLIHLVFLHRNHSSDRDIEVLSSHFLLIDQNVKSQLRFLSDYRRIWNKNLNLVFICSTSYLFCDYYT